MGTRCAYDVLPDEPVNRQRGAGRFHEVLDALQQDGIVAHRRLPQQQVCPRLIDRVEREKPRSRRRADVQVITGGFNRIVDDIEVINHVGTCRAVVPIGEHLDQLLGVLVGIPQQFPQQPAAKLDHLHQHLGGFLEDARYPVLCHELKIRTQDAQVGMRDVRKAEVHHVIPHVNRVGDRQPVRQFLVEFGVERVGKGHAVGGMDVRQPDNDVTSRPGDERRLERLLVSQRFEHEARKLQFQIGGDGIHEAQHQPGGTALLGNDGLAGDVLAEHGVVNERYRNQRRVRIRQDIRPDVVHELLAHVFVEEIQSPGIPLTFVEGIPIGMIVKIPVRGEVPRGTMPGVPGDRDVLVPGAAVLVLQQFVVSTVELVARRPVAVGREVQPVVCCPAFEGRHVLRVHRVHDQGGQVGNRRGIQGPPVNAHVVFQEGVDRVEGSPGTGAGEDQVVPVIAEHDAFSAQAGRGKRRIGQPGCIGPDQQIRPAGLEGVKDRKRGPRDPAQEIGQLLGRVLVRNARAGIHHDKGPGQAIARDREGNRRRGRQNKPDFAQARVPGPGSPAGPILLDALGGCDDDISRRRAAETHDLGYRRVPRRSFRSPRCHPGNHPLVHDRPVRGIRTARDGILDGHFPHALHGPVSHVRLFIVVPDPHLPEVMGLVECELNPMAARDGAPSADRPGIQAAEPHEGSRVAGHHIAALVQCPAGVDARAVDRPDGRPFRVGSRHCNRDRARGVPPVARVGISHRIDGGRTHDRHQHAED